MKYSMWQAHSLKKILISEVILLTIYACIKKIIFINIHAVVKVLFKSAVAFGL